MRPVITFNFFVFSQICLVQQQTMSNVFNKKICGGLLSCKTIMTSYTRRCTRTRRVCWCKFGRNPTRSFCVICNLVSLSLILRQDLSLDFACLFIYSLAISPELFVCLSIYENAEIWSQRHWFLTRWWCSSKEEVNQCSNRVVDKQRS